MAENKIRIKEYLCNLQEIKQRFETAQAIIREGYQQIETAKILYSANKKKDAVLHLAQASELLVKSLVLTSRPLRKGKNYTTESDYKVLIDDFLRREYGHEVQKYFGDLIKDSSEFLKRFLGIYKKGWSIAIRECAHITFKDLKEAEKVVSITEKKINARLRRLKTGRIKGNEKDFEYDAVVEDLKENIHILKQEVVNYRQLLKESQKITQDSLNRTFLAFIRCVIRRLPSNEPTNIAEHDVIKTVEALRLTELLLGTLNFSIRSYLPITVAYRLGIPLRAYIRTLYYPTTRMYREFVNNISTDPCVENFSAMCDYFYSAFTELEYSIKQYIKGLSNIIAKLSALSEVECGANRSEHGGEEDR